MTVICNIMPWNENVIILMKFSSLAALKVVMMTTFSAASDENFVNFQCSQWWKFHQNDRKLFVSVYHMQHSQDKDRTSVRFSTDKRFNISPLHVSYEVPVREKIDTMTSSNGNIFCLTGHLCREFTGHRWIPRTKTSDTELWCCLWSPPE